MNLDLGEGEPGRTEDLTGRSRTGRWEAGGSGWTTRPWRPWAAVATVCAVLAIITRWPGWTLLAVFACLTGIALLAWRSSDSRPRRTRGTSASGLTLHARRADIALLAIKSGKAARATGPWFAHGARLASGVRSRRPRRSSGTWSTDDTTAAARRALGQQDAGDDRGREGDDG